MPGMSKASEDRRHRPQFSSRAVQKETPGQQPARPLSTELSLPNVMRLQRSVGNKAVGHMFTSLGGMSPVVVQRELDEKQVKAYSRRLKTKAAKVKSGGSIATFVADVKKMLTTDGVSASKPHITQLLTDLGLDVPDNLADLLNPPKVQTRRGNQSETGEGGAMDKLPNKDSGVVDILINKFAETLVSTDEAGVTKDYIVTHERNTNRIDRQGPSRDGTHARFAVQIGTATYAGIEMEADTQFTVGFVRAALRESLVQKKYIRIFA